MSYLSPDMIAHDPAMDVRAALPSLADRPERYPDARPAAERRPFLYAAGEAWTLDEDESGAAVAGWLRGRRARIGIADRVAVLAVGSNAYPRQLADKFEGTDADDQGIAVVRASARGLGIAFCPLLARKGYVPVTLAERPDAQLSTWLQWLTPDQLQIISASEGGRYSLVGGEPLAARIQLHPRLPHPERAYAWWFASVLAEAEGGDPVWLDPSDGDQQARLIAAASSPLNPSRRQSPPAGWDVVDRGAEEYWEALLDRPRYGHSA